MKSILFLHDTALSLKRGAELTITQLISKGEELGYVVSYDLLNDFNIVKSKISQANLVVLCSASRCKFEIDLLNFLLKNDVDYIKIEFDYNFCVRRNVLCVLNSKIKNCCNTEKYHIYRNVFANSRLNIFQSPKHYQYHYDFYGDAVSNYLIKCPTIAIDKIVESKEKLNTIPFFGDLNYLKGGHAFVDYAEEHPERKFVVYGKNQLRRTIPKNISFTDYINNQEVLQILGKTKEVIIKPVWPEPSGRLATEAFLSGCELITNDRVGTWSFDFYPNDKARATKEISETIPKLWDTFASILSTSKEIKEQSLGDVLVKKSYGGLGDIFFTIPAVYNLSDVASSVTYALHPRLVDFFKKHLKGIDVVSEENIDESQYDKLIELGNYPKFSEATNHLSYITSKKVKQHAIQHYIDAIARLHSGISNTNKEYPYFNKKTNLENPYYTVHPGAGFLLKAWPITNFAQLIELIYNFYPELSVKIIKGPNDPDIVPHLKTKNYTIVDGDIDDVGNVVSGALFHIGNDAGITHLAGAFNIPIVTIYGPTGPGSWGAFSENTQLIWGKRGNCSISCNYNVIINCENRVCLNNVNPKMMFYSLLKLFLDLDFIATEQYYFNPNFEITKENKSYIFKSMDNEYLVDFTDAESLNFFNSLLIENQVNTSIMPKQFAAVFDGLVKLNIFTPIIKLNL